MRRCILGDPCFGGEKMRLFAISDLHVQYPANWRWLLGLPMRRYEDDALIVAGDISHDVGDVTRCLSMLSSKFRHVFFLPGNHDVWLKNDEYPDSIAKLDALLEAADNLGVHTRPLRLGDDAAPFVVVPLHSWYDSSLGVDDPLSKEDADLIHGWSDEHFCKWPKGTAPTDVFRRNESVIADVKARYPGVPVISFSHMVPRRDLLPARNYLTFGFLPHVVGSTTLEAQLRQLGSAVHVFGHSHISCERALDGVRYVQNALGYPREREQWSLTPRLLQVWPNPVP